MLGQKAPRNPLNQLGVSGAKGILGSQVINALLPLAQRNHAALKPLSELTAPHLNGRGFISERIKNDLTVLQTQAVVKGHMRGR